MPIIRQATPGDIEALANLLAGKELLVCERTSEVASTGHERGSPPSMKDHFQ